MRHVPFALLFAVSVSLTALALSVPLHADTGSGSGSTGSATATSSPAMPTTGSAVADPLEHPLAAIDQVKQAKQTSWPILVGLCLVMLTKALAYGSLTLQTVPVIGVAARWLAIGKHAMAVAAAGTLAAAGYNALVAGGTWVAALIAAGLAGAGLMHSTTQPVSKLPTATLVSGVTAGVLAIVIATCFVVQPACGTTGGAVVSTLLDCGKEDQTGIETAYDAMKAKLESGGSWSSVAAAAGGVAISVIACALADLVQEHLSAKKAMPVDQSWAAHDALEQVRAQLGGATIRSVKYGNL